MIPIPVRVAFLRKIHLFQDLAEEDLTRIADEKILDEKSYKAGEQIFTQGSQGDRFFLIFIGKVRVAMEHNGQQIELAILVAGDYFGDSILFTEKRHSAGVTAIGDTTLLSLSYSNIEALSRQFQKVRANYQILFESRRLAAHLPLEWLQVDEVVYFVARKHYIWLIKTLTMPIFILLVSIPLIVWSVLAHSWLVVVLSMIPFFAMIVWGIWEAIDWSNSYYIVTNERVISLKKVIGVYVSRQEALLSAVLSVDAEADTTGRILDYGNIIVRTFVSKIEFTHVAHLNRTEQLIKEHWIRSKHGDEKNVPREHYGGYMDSFELITELKQQLSELPYQDSAKLDALRRRAEMIIRNLFGLTSKYLDDLNHISFYPMVIPSTEASDVRSWKSGCDELWNLFNTMEEELRLFQHTSKQDSGTILKQVSNQIFIVHGHDEEMKQYVARIITRLELDPIILHEKPNQGRTIIEKITDYSNVSFAVILLSPDDIARKRNDSPDVVKSRARQNVVLELGYFLGKLGRNRVIALYREDANFEMPSDYSGVLFVPFDSAGRWQFDLVKELKASGFDVDANKLI